MSTLTKQYMCFNERGDISTLNGGPLKLVDEFSYLGSSGSSTKNDINTQLAKYGQLLIGCHMKVIPIQ